MQYFSYFATQPQNRDITINENYAQQIGYDAITANKMARSGMIAIPASLMMRLLQAQEETMAPISGSIPIDEINIANPPSHTFQDLASQGPPLVGFLVDRNYRITFRARQPGSQALYGASNILRDQYSDFYSGLNLSNLVRCKHYCAPIVDVQSIAEIVDIVNAIPIHDKEGVFFRGQGRLYTLGRDEQVNRLLFGDSCSLEPSLITSAARKPLYDYDALHFALKRFLEDWILGRDGCTQEQETKWQERQTSPLCEVDYALLALAQHYGLPTHGLDVTTSLEVALWFATHRFSKDADGFATYKAMEQADWPAPAEDYPVVIACQSVTRSISPSLHECHELEDFGLKALRPTRQSARFFLGGHSDHQNRLAEAIVCIFRLHPGYYSSELTFEHLFPNPDEDEAYRFMVNFSRIKAFHTLGTSAINYFHRSCGNPVPM